MKKSVLISLPLLAFVAASCGFGGTTIVTSGISIPSVEPGQPDQGDGYQKISSFSYNLQDSKKTTGQYSLPSKGDSYLLVVPVAFSNAPVWSSTMLDNLNKAFFGGVDDTAWQSVSSFYEVSSYSNLHIKGKIADPLSIPLTTFEASKHTSSGNPAPDEVAIEYFNSTSYYDSLRREYDKNGDGLIDSIVFVYSNTIDGDRGYWAWVYWYSGKPNLSRPAINSYLWMSYGFFTGTSYAGYGNGIDSHTAIHEVGHLLGLDDYYNYDKGDKYDASGGIEMHSYNIGDDNIYSKFALGWVNPYYVKTSGSVTLKLRTSAFFGDAVIINDLWNKNALDEYLVIEYYTPTGMNEQDARSIYKPNGTDPDDPNQMFTVNGFRIYHIDSRLVELDSRGNSKGYVNSLGDGFYAVGASNSPSRSYLSGQFAVDYKYVHLLESNGKNTFKTGQSATNETLFKKGSSFVASSEFFPNGSKFNNGSEVGYKVEIGDCNDDYGTLTISKI